MPELCRMILDVDTGIDAATKNPLRILELAGRDEIPVARGPGRSLLKPFVKGADHVHGANGLGDVALPEPTGRAESAPDLIIRMAHENPGEITLCPVGPVTNVALALAKAPETATLLKRIVVMGSTIFHPGIQGIPSPMADANFWNDPEAAQIVLRSGANLTLVGMDVTMKVLLTAPMCAEIAGNGGAVGAKMMEIAQFYVDAYNRMYPGIDGCGLHDPLPVAIAEDPP